MLCRIFRSGSFFVRQALDCLPTKKQHLYSLIYDNSRVTLADVQNLSWRIEHAQNQTMTVLDLCLRNVAATERLREVLCRQSLKLCLDRYHSSTLQAAFLAFRTGLDTLAIHAEETDGVQDGKILDTLSVDHEGKDAANISSYTHINCAESYLPSSDPGSLQLPEVSIDIEVSNGEVPSGQGEVELHSSRQRLTESPITGRIVKCFGKFGWILPDKPLEHPMAKRHHGKIYVTRGDLVNATRIIRGFRCVFHVYSDPDGLGAEHCFMMSSQAGGDFTHSSPPCHARGEDASTFVHEIPGAHSPHQ